MAALGLAGIARFMLAYDRPLHFAAGAFLLYLGLRGLFARSKEPGPDRFESTPAHAFGSAIVLTLTNPPTIVSFAAVFVVLAPASGFDAKTALITVAGIFAGSSLWWLLLASAVSLVRHAIGSRTRRFIGAVSNAALGAFGIGEIHRALAPPAR